MQTGIYLKGLEELERNADRITKELTSKRTELLSAQAQIVKDAIKNDAPKGPTGNLKRSTYKKVYPESTQYPAVAFAGIRPRIAPHAHLVEYGHLGPHPAPAHPFFQPAWESVKGQVLQNIKDGLKEIIEGGL